jgi:hypothetical protein
VGVRGPFIPTGWPSVRRTDRLQANVAVLGRAETNGSRPFPFFTTSQGAVAIFIADKGPPLTVPGSGASPASPFTPASRHNTTRPKQPASAQEETDLGAFL